MSTTQSSTGPTLRVYVYVWIGMLVIVAVETVLARAHLSGRMLLASLLLLAVIEAALALRYLMHLKYEVPLLFWTLIPGLLLAFLMMNQFWADAARLNTLRFPAP